MGTISLVIPQIGQPDTTEDVKLQNDLTTIQAVINGNLDDSNLKSPNGAVRRLLMSQYFIFVGAFAYTTGAYCWAQTSNGAVIASGASGSGMPQLWTEDTSLVVSGKTTMGVVRLATVTNGTASGVTLNGGITALTSLGGGSNTLAPTFSAPSLSTAQIALTTSSFQTADSAAFTLPTTPTHGYIPVLALTGTSPVPPSAFVGATVSLYAYLA